MIDDIENLSAEKIVVRAVAGDGGTRYIEVTIEGDDGHFYFVDGRIGSQSAGEIFTEYPGTENSRIVSPQSTLSKSIKAMLKS